MYYSVYPQMKPIPMVYLIHMLLVKQFYYALCISIKSAVTFLAGKSNDLKFDEKVTIYNFFVLKSNDLDNFLKLS